jgi:gas vesicle protein
MSDNDDKSTMMSVLAGIGLGAIIGAAAGLLFAPKPGTETREDLKKAAEDLKSRAEGIVSELSTQVDELMQRSKELADTTRTKVQQAVEAGKQAMADKRKEMETEEAAES